MVNIKGHEITPIVVRDSYNRRAQQYTNKIIAALRRLDLTEDDIDVSMQAMPIKKIEASASWYFEGYHMHYSHNGQSKYVDNLYVVMRVIECEIDALLQERRTVDQFIHDFVEDTDIKKQRKEARETLGLPEDTQDIDLINKTYKNLAKEHHPDKASGSHENFKKINNAHKILKRELS